MDTEITYEKVGDYYYPNITMPSYRLIGRWGRMHMRYLEQQKPIQYNIMLMNGSLFDYLADLNEQAEARLDVIISQMAKAEGINEALKAANQLAWVQHMNVFRACAEEIIMAELICVS